MEPNYKGNFERIIAARERLLSVRADRVENLLRLRMYLRVRLNDFLSNVDPVSGARLAELQSEGNKTYGDLALILAFFDGTRLKIGVDGFGHFHAEATPDIFEGIGSLVDVRVNTELSAAEFDYTPQGAAAGSLHLTADFSRVVGAIVEASASAIEGQLPPGAARETFSKGPAEEPLRAAQGMTFNVR